MKSIGNLTGSQSRKACIFLLSGLVAAGILAGAVFEVKHGGGASPWIHQYFAPVHSGGTSIEVFRNTFFSSALFVTAAFLTGLFALGQPIGTAMLIYRGFGIGLSAAVMYGLYGGEAVTPVLVLIVPKAVAVVAVSLLAVREVIRSSGAILLCLISGNSREEKRMDFKLYCLKFIVLIFISLIIALADMAMSYIFSGLV